MREIRRSFAPALPKALALAGTRAAQSVWAHTAVPERLRILRKARRTMALSAEWLAASVPQELPGNLHRNAADTLVGEVLPLIEGCRFLEREAETILQSRKAPPDSRPFWLRGVSTEFRRDAFGIILIIGPGNYPLFLPGIQTLQALAAGNAVVWKPAPGGSGAANALRSILVSAGLNPRLLLILSEDTPSVMEAIDAGVDKVFLTGSTQTGRSVLRALSSKLIPAVVELSGCDAVFVLEDADLVHVATAVSFGLRLNGSATCMAPRRMFIQAETLERLLPVLIKQLASIAPVPVPLRTRELLAECMADAVQLGASIACGGIEAAGVRPIVLLNVIPQMLVARSDIFAPVLSLINVHTVDAALNANEECPYALTASVFGSRKRALRLAERITAGSIFVNDLIVSSADPRAPFGGRRTSGFGVARGREGLLEMTAVKTVQINKGIDLRRYQETTREHEGLFAGYIRLVHGTGLRERARALVQLVKAARRVASIYNDSKHKSKQFKE